MPLNRIEMEEVGPKRWVAEVERGGMTATRVTLRGESVAEVLAKVIALYGVEEEVQAELDLAALEAAKVPQSGKEDGTEAQDAPPLPEAQDAPPLPEPAPKAQPAVSAPKAPKAVQAAL